MLARPQPAEKPPIYVAEADYERLSNLARVSDAPGALLLSQELDRALVVAADAAEPTPFVRLGSWVEYRDLASGRARAVQVVIPEAADIDQQRLSVLSPVGAALIGLSVGDTFGWTAEDGRPRVLSVQWVGEAPPARKRARARA